MKPCSMSFPFSCLSRRPLSSLLRRKLGLHLPSRRQNHLVPPSLQRSLSLFTVGAPALALLVLLALCSAVFRGRCLANLALEVVSRNQVGLGRLFGLLCRRTRVPTRWGLSSNGRWLERNRRLST